MSGRHSPRLLRDVRVQYFLMYGMIGTVLPYASVFFRDAGLTRAQVGYAYAIWSGSIILSPVLVTLAADTRADPRRLMVLGLSVSGLSLIALGRVHGVWPLLAVWTIHCLASLPLMPLQDGICFSLQRRRREQGLPDRPFHRVRVWGTVGFIVPSLLLFWLIYAGMPVSVVLMSGAVFAGLAGVQALLLDDPRPSGTADADAPADRPRLQLPTAKALTVLLRPGLFVFCAAALLGQMSGTILGAFYPVYLTERAGVAAKWIGLIANVGVVVEIFFVLGCGWLTSRLGVKGLLVVGLACTAARMGLLAASDHPGVAIATQLFHGIQVVGLWVMPQTFVDRHAGDQWRHSMQGVFVMLSGAARAVGSLAAGWVAGYSLQGVFTLAAALCLAGLALALLAFPGSQASEAAPACGRGAPKPVP